MNVATAVSGIACATIMLSIARIVFLVRGTGWRAIAGSLLFPASLLPLAAFALGCCAFGLMGQGAALVTAVCCLAGGVVAAVNAGTMARAARSEWERSRVRLLDDQVAAQEAHLAALRALRDGASAEQERGARLLRAVSNALAEGDVARVRSLVEESAKPASRCGGRCAHPVISAVLSAKAALCNGEGIVWRENVAVPARLPLSDAELGALFANALDNAINAQRKLPADAPRFVSVRARVAHGVLAVVVENACAPASFDAGASSAEGRSSSEPASLVEDAAFAGAASAAETSPATEIAPAAEAMSATEAAPATESVSATEAAPVGDAAPVAPALSPDRAPEALPAHGWGTCILDEIASQHGGKITRTVDGGVFRFDAVIPL